MKNTMLSQLKNRLRGYTLDELLDEIAVMGPGMAPVQKEMEDWSAVTTDEGIVAWFGEEAEAFRYRLDLINQILNT